MKLEAKLFGIPEVRVLGEPLEVAGKTLGLLYAMLISPLSRAEATSLLWGDDAAQSLRQALVVLRKLPHAKDWLLDHETLAVQADTDLLRFEAALAAQDSARAIELGSKTLLEGIQLKSGAFMEWLNAKRSQHECGLAAALRQEIARLEQSHAQLALGYALKLLELDPLDEPALQIALRLEVQLGQRESAQTRLGQFRRLLKTELGSEPLPETLELLGQNNLAQRFARAQSLAPTQTDVAFWAEVLGVGALELAELEQGTTTGEIPEKLRLHLEKQIAQTLEKRFDALHPRAYVQAAQIAQHFQKALEPRAGLPWWMQAGQLALKVAALPDSQAAYFAALWIAEDEIPRRDCLIALGNLGEAKNELALMHSVALELQRLGTVLQDDLTLFHAQHRLAAWAIRSAQANLALDAATKAIQIASRIQHPEMQAMAYGSLGTAHMALGQLLQAKEALLLVLPTENPQLRLRAFANLGSVAGMLGQLEESVLYLESALTIARSLQNLPTVGMILYNLGASAEKLANLKSAETHFREAVEIASRLSNPAMLLQSTLALAQIHAARGHWGESFNTACEALELAENLPALPQVQMLLGELELRFGRFEAAKHLLELAQTGFEAANNQRLQLSAAANLALVNLQLGELPESAVQAALESLRQAGHQDQFDHIRLEYALLGSDKKQLAWALEGLDDSRLSVRVARARLAKLSKKKLEPDLSEALFSALAQEIYVDVPLGFVLLGQAERAQEVQVLSAAGLPKVQREALLSLRFTF
jgi:DNA-binding SARP family transcriptional activator/tetratricopeptide (TPR) repeat protein